MVGMFDGHSVHTHIPVDKRDGYTGTFGHTVHTHIPVDKRDGSTWTFGHTVHTHIPVDKHEELFDSRTAPCSSG